jgi:glycosyltransferase involved in cell wall biosynthesis
MTEAVRILLVIDGLGAGGAERSLAELAVGLRDRGRTVTVAYQRDRAGVREDLAAAGIPLVHLGGRRWLGRMRQLRSLLRTDRPDLVHASLVSSNLLARVSSWHTGVPCACSFTALPYGEGAFLADHRVRRAVVRAADGFTARHLQAAGHAVSQEVADHAVAHLGINPASVTVVPRGRGRARLGQPGGERRAAERRARGLTAGDLLVVTLGRQEPVKGHAGLVDAWAEVAAQHPRARLVIAGRAGAATPAIQAAVARLGPDARGQIDLPGAVTDVGALLCAADLFVLPSSVEGLPGALVEALAMALPVVASDLPSIREVVPPDRHAVLVPPGDPVALGDAISALLADEGRRREMGAANLRRFEERFTLDRALDGTEAFYAGVVGRSGAAEAVVDGLVEPAEQETEPVERSGGVDPDA